MSLLEKAIPEHEPGEQLLTAVQGGVLPGEVKEPLLVLLLHPTTHRQPGEGGGGRVAPL